MKKSWFLIKLVLIILNLLCLPVTLFLLLCLLIYKQVICLMAKCFQNFEKPIPGPSSIFVSDEFQRKPHSVVVAAIGLNRICSKNELIRWWETGYDIRDEFGQRRYGELAYTPARYYGYGFWEKVPNFKITDRIHDLSEIIGTSAGEIPMHEIIALLQRKSFKPNEPLWDMYLHKHQNENRTILYFRFHHMLGDGLSFTKFIFGVSRCDQVAETFLQPKSSISEWSHIQKSIISGLLTGIQLISMGTVEYLHKLLLMKDRNSMNFDLNGKLKMTGIWRNTAGKRLDLQDIKKVSKRLQCSVSHIVLAAINIAMGKYFVKYHGYQESPGFQYVTLLPMPGHPNKRLVNYWSVGKFSSPDSRLEVRQKIEHFKYETKKTYTSVEAIFMFQIFQNIAQFVPWTVLDFFYKAKAYSSITISNVIGPQDGNVVMAESKITDMWFWLPIAHGSVALSAGILSCNGGIRINLTADVGCIRTKEELEDLADMMNSAVTDIVTLYT